MKKTLLSVLITISSLFSYDVADNEVCFQTKSEIAGLFDTVQCVNYTGDNNPAYWEQEYINNQNINFEKNRKRTVNVLVGKDVKVRTFDDLNYQGVQQTFYKNTYNINQQNHRDRVSSFRISGKDESQFDPNRNMLCMYTENNYQGKESCFEVKNYYEENLFTHSEEFGKNIKSLKIGKDIKIKMWDGVGFFDWQNQYETKKDIPNLSSHGITKLGSFKIYGPDSIENTLEGQDIVCFYEHPSYEGNTWCYKESVGFTHGANDIFSSVKKFGSIKVTIYEHGNHQGNSRSIEGNEPHLRDFDDKISSIAISKKEYAVCFYEHAKYKGKEWCHEEGNTSWVGNDPNDKYSSLRILKDNIQVTIYEHGNYQGNSRTYEKDKSFLDGFNDQTSSVKTIDSHNPYAVCFYEHAEYKGKEWCHEEGNTSWVGNDSNDKYSSLKILKDNIQVTIYEHGNYQGNSRTYEKDESFLHGFNDQTSSVKVVR
jgi:hypothetical protein